MEELNVDRKVFLLWFVSEEDEREDHGLLIGVYERESDAQVAIARLQSQPGFVDYPQGFQIHSRELGKDSWTEGFIRDSEIS